MVIVAHVVSAIVAGNKQVKVTKKQLKQIIKEELESALAEAGMPPRFSSPAPEMPERAIAERYKMGIMLKSPTQGEFYFDYGLAGDYAEDIRSAIDSLSGTDKIMDTVVNLPQAIDYYLKKAGKPAPALEIIKDMIVVKKMKLTKRRT